MRSICVLALHCTLVVRCAASSAGSCPAGKFCYGGTCNKEAKKSTAAAKCSTVPAIAGFCGSGKEYDSGKAATECATSECKASTTADVTACCKDSAAAACSTISGTANFCPAGKEYDSGKAATECATNECKASTTADVTACCKDSPASQEVSPYISPEPHNFQGPDCTASETVAIPTDCKCLPLIATASSSTRASTGGEMLLLGVVVLALVAYSEF